VPCSARTGRGHLAHDPALAIPPDGLVLSGHGEARSFLVVNAAVGSTVVFDEVESGTTPVPEPVPTPIGGGLPARVVGGYWTYWGAPRLADVPAQYNTVYLFSARPVGGQPGSTGAVFFEQSVQSEASFVADIAALRDSGRAVILSVGGAGEYLNTGTRAREDAFVASIVSIYDRLGGFDGLDWNIESADLPIANMVSASERRDHAVANIGQWVTAAGGADKVGFGFRNVGPASETMTVASAVQVWEEASARHPGLRGAMVWSIELDRSINYGFARDLAAAIHD